jgi:hypothetical protein
MGLNWGNGCKIGQSLEGSQLLVRLDSYIAKVNTSMENQVELGCEDFYVRLKELKTAFISASRGLGGRLGNVKLKLIEILDSSSRGFFTNITHLTTNPHSELNAGADAASHVQTVIVGNDDASKELARVESRVDTMEHKIHGLLAKSDESAILFAGLKFQSISELNAWL